VAAVVTAKLPVVLQRKQETAAFLVVPQLHRTKYWLVSALTYTERTLLASME